MQINYDFFYRLAELGDINGLDRMIKNGANIHERCDHVFICAICANKTETSKSFTPNSPISLLPIILNNIKNKK